MKNDRIQSFSSRLQEAMNIRDVKQADLCALTQIPKSAMSQYVNGAFEPKQDRLWKLAHALQVSEAWLMGYDVPMDPTLLKEVPEKSSLRQSEEDLIVLARHLEKIPKETRDRLVKNFGDAIDTYLDAMGIPREDE
nr:MAG TPA: bifunctional HTH-domain containing protein/aminotransferase [Caudoviricetes sp.]